MPRPKRVSLLFLTTDHQATNKVEFMFFTESVFPMMFLSFCCFDFSVFLSPLASFKYWRQCGRRGCQCCCCCCCCCHCGIYNGALRCGKGFRGRGRGGKSPASPLYGGFFSSVAATSTALPLAMSRETNILTSTQPHDASGMTSVLTTAPFFTNTIVVSSVVPLVVPVALICPIPCDHGASGSDSADFDHTSKKSRS